MPGSLPSASLDQQDGTLYCRGKWTVDALQGLPSQWQAGSGVTMIDASGVTRLDTAGAVLLQDYLRQIRRHSPEAAVQGLSGNARALFERFKDYASYNDESTHTEPGRLEKTGRQVLEGLEELFAFLSFAGEISLRLAVLLPRPWKIRWRPVWVDLGQSGAHALGIVGLLGFLMGVVIAYQGAVQLKIYGANVYVADLVGLSMVRELAPLLAAIIVAGRTGSAYTAQIGTMKVTEEVSALHTIGIPPIDVLVIPKIIALILALPLLSVFADVMGVLGGMVMAKLQLGLGFTPFLDRLNDAVTVKSFLLGLMKAPVFAFIIALIGCFQGFRVGGSAESVGSHTTLSVVQSIFLVIVADAQFSIIFSWLGI